MSSKGSRPNSRLLTDLFDVSTVEPSLLIGVVVRILETVVVANPSIAAVGDIDILDAAERGVLADVSWSVTGVGRRVDSTLSAWFDDPHSGGRFGDPSADAIRWRRSVNQSYRELDEFGRIATGAQCSD